MLDYNYMEEEMGLVNINALKEILVYLKLLAKRYNLPFKEYNNLIDKIV